MKRPRRTSHFVARRAFAFSSAIAICTALTLQGFATELTPDQDFLSEHCLACHDSASKEGGLDLETLAQVSLKASNTLRQSESAAFESWVKVLDRVRAGEMPPPSEPAPSTQQSESYCNALEDKLHAISTTDQDRHGRVVYRRLNRTEYANTIRDLLCVTTPLEEMLPEDATEDGFDNVGRALNLSVAHLERYLAAADRALLDATANSSTSPTKTIRTDYEETWHDYNHGFQNSQWVNAKDGNLALIGGGGSIPHGTLRAWSPPVADATYRFRVRARAMMQRKDSGQERLVHDRAIIARLGLGSQFKDGSTEPIAYVELSPDQYREFEFYARVPGGQSFSIEPHRIVKQDPNDKAMQWGMCIVVDWIDIEGPIYGDGRTKTGGEQTAAWPPEGHRLLYGNATSINVSSESCTGARIEAQPDHQRATSLLQKFLPLAFRRPVTEDELQWHLELFDEQIAEGQTFDAAIRAAYKLALTSPAFLFLEESPGPLNDHALACRLSYGLWGSAPDDELRKLADEGRLQDSTVLRQQTQRLLDSPNAQRFANQFLDSWLNLRDINFTTPDLKLYPEFDSYLQASMLAETRRYFAEMVHSNLPASSVVASDFAYLNPRLAEHYGLTAAYKAQLEASTQHTVRSGPTFPPERERLIKVALPDGSHRGGLITQGAVLKVSANGTNTSPIVRGAYFLERILGTPPSPPPANVPAVEPDIRGATTIREQLAKHRDQVACASCHAIIDPPGFALESFDATGRWRKHYRIIPESAADKTVKNAGSEVVYYEDGPQVESHYQLADGRRFADIDEFRELMLADNELIARCLVEKLTTHLTGAKPQFADRRVIDNILNATRADGFRVKDLIHAVIQSRMFRHR